MQVKILIKTNINLLRCKCNLNWSYNNILHAREALYDVTERGAILKHLHSKLIDMYDRESDAFHLTVLHQRVCSTSWKGKGLFLFSLFTFI